MLDYGARIEKPNLAGTARVQLLLALPMDGGALRSFSLPGVQA